MQKKLSPLLGGARCLIKSKDVSYPSHSQVSQEVQSHSSSPKLHLHSEFCALGNKKHIHMIGVYMWSYFGAM